MPKKRKLESYHDLMRQPSKENLTSAKKRFLAVSLPDAPIVQPNKKTINKLYDTFDLHGIRERARAIRVHAASIEIAMVNTGDPNTARSELLILETIIHELRMLLRGT